MVDIGIIQVLNSLQVNAPATPVGGQPNMLMIELPMFRDRFMGTASAFAKGTFPLFNGMEGCRKCCVVRPKYSQSALPWDSHCHKVSVGCLEIQTSCRVVEHMKIDVICYLAVGIGW